MQSKDDFIAALAGGPVEVDADGKKIFLRALDPADVRQCRAWQKESGDELAYQFLFVRSVVAADGTRLFADDDKAEVDRLPFSFVNAVVDQVMRLNQLGEYQKKTPSPATTS